MGYQDISEEEKQERAEIERIWRSIYRKPSGELTGGENAWRFWLALYRRKP